MDSKIDVKEIFVKFSKEDWFNWIEDIINYDFAFPVHRFSQDGDPLMDVLDFLKVNQINTKIYEDAINSITRIYFGSQVYTAYLERLVNVMVYSKSMRFKNRLLELYTDPALDHAKGSYDYLKAKILFGFSRIDLEDEDKRIIKEYSQLSEASQFNYDPSFVGHYLRFIRVHYLPLFFENITRLCKTIPFDDQDESFQLSIVTVIVDKLNDYHYNNKTTFYSAVFNWITDVYIGLSNKLLFIKILHGLKRMFNTHKVIKHELSINGSQQVVFGKQARLLLNFIGIDESFASQPLAEVYDFFKFFQETGKLNMLKEAFRIKELNSYFKNNYTLYSNYFSYHPGNQLYNKECIIVDQIAIVAILDQVILSPLRERDTHSDSNIKQFDEERRRLFESLDDL